MGHILGQGLKVVQAETLMGERGRRAGTRTSDHSGKLGRKGTSITSAGPGVIWILLAMPALPLPRRVILGK